MGGSNDLQSSPIFFCQLFITFVHRIKKHNPKLKKSGNLKHPNESAHNGTLGIGRLKADCLPDVAIQCHNVDELNSLISAGDTYKDVRPEI